MRSSFLGLLIFAVTAICTQPLVKLTNDDDLNWCISVEIRRQGNENQLADQGWISCGNEATDLANIGGGPNQGAVEGDLIIIWAEWDAGNTAACGWSAGSVEFTMPGYGVELIWKNNCVSQVGTSWFLCTKPVKCSEAGGANPYFQGEERCEENLPPPPGTGCIEGQ